MANYPDEETAMRLASEQDRAPREEYPDPTPQMLDGDPLFDAIWKAIKGWDISRHNDGIYNGPTGNDARRIYDAVKPVTVAGMDVRCEVGGCTLKKVGTTIREQQSR